MSDVRHLGATEVIEFANQLRMLPGKDLGAEAALLSRSAPVLPQKKAWKPRKKKGEGADAGLTPEEQKAKEMADLEIVRLMKVIEGLQAQKAKRDTELREAQELASTLALKMKSEQAEEETLENQFVDLTEENTELSKDLDRNNDRCVQDRISINGMRAKMADLEDILLEAERAKNNVNGVSDIKVVFGPCTADQGELKEHNGEMVWFDTIKLPHAMAVQDKVKADRSRKTGGRTEEKSLGSSGGKLPRA
jgi:hypothetical protein